MEKNKIGIAQMMLLLFLSRVFTALTYFPGMNNPVSGTAMLFGQILGYGVVLLLFLPLLWMLKRYPERSLAMNLQAVSRRGSVPVNLIYLAFVILLAANTLAHFQFFMTNAIFQEASAWAIIIPMMIVAVYAAHVGIEGICRSGFLLFCAFIIAFLFIMFSSIPEIKLTNLKPMEENALSQILRGAYGVVSRSVEILMLYLLLPYLKKGKLGAGVTGFAVLSFVVFELIAFFLLAVLGDFAKSQTFPFYTLASMAGISIFQRMDALYMGIWVFVAFIRLALLLFIAGDLLALILPPRKNVERKRGFCLGMISVLVFALAIPLCYDMKLLNGCYQLLYTGLLVLTLVLVIPVITLIILKIKSKRSERNG